MNILQTLSDELKISLHQTEAAVRLLDDGATVPFIARYRKEATGALDDTTLRALHERLDYLRNLEKRREEIAALITAQGKMTPEISEKLSAAAILTEIEDIYRPFRPKRRTRASVAREKGLEPLAALLTEQRTRYMPELLTEAAKYISAEQHVETAADALRGACDILAEDISDNADFRKTVRSLTVRHGILTSVRTGEDPKETYRMYYDYQEPIRTIPGHRILALNRAEKEGVVRISCKIEKDLILNQLLSETVKNVKSPAYPYLASAVADSYDRLIAPSVENEIRSSLFDRACEGAIRLFSENLKNLRRQAPVRGKTDLGFDPGYRTGCKLAVTDSTGKVLDTAVIYPTKPQERTVESARILRQLIDRHHVDIIAVGNGTASKESEIFVADAIREYRGSVRYLIVNEAGASVYSASNLGAEEFPDFDATQRSAVSLARRVQDPLAELVKIEPQAIGVGQYQHDMKASVLSEALRGVVEDCVNRVGVDLNTASYSLLSYIAGISAAAAKSIVRYREEHGAFQTRAQLLKVPRIGSRVYEQCAGFLRVPASEEILDNTGVHPESYGAAHLLLSRFSLTEEDVRQGRLSALRKQANAYGTARLAAELSIGEPTLNDIISELEKPGRDIRDSLPQPQLRSDLMDLADLKPGMCLCGTVRNVTDFGAFVDIGVHQDGLVHISQLSDRFIRHPSEVVSIGDSVQVRVLEVDPKTRRIALSMKQKS